MTTSSQPDPVAPRMPTPPAHSVPRGACDSHTHVFGPYDRFPFERPSSYPPPLAPFEVHADMLARAGLDRVVLVQPAPYGRDSRALVDALQRYGGRARGIATTASDIGDAELEALHAAGVRGLRFSEVIDRGTGRPFAGSVGLDQLKGLASRLRALGWHAQVWTRAEHLAACADACERQGVPVVFEHMGYFDAALGPGHEHFQQLVARIREGTVWAKLALCRNSSNGSDYPDLRPFHDSLLEANPARLVWASDWPFVRMGDAAPDVGRLLDLARTWVGDDEVWRRVLVENPALLYGFES